jgi:hypothetical protein
MEQLNIHRDKFHGEWNYTILPAKRQESDSVIS